MSPTKAQIDCLKQELLCLVDWSQVYTFAKITSEYIAKYGQKMPKLSCSSYKDLFANHFTSDFKLYVANGALRISKLEGIINKSIVTSKTKPKSNPQSKINPGAVIQIDELLTRFLGLRDWKKGPILVKDLELLYGKEYKSYIPVYNCQSVTGLITRHMKSDFEIHWNSVLNGFTIKIVDFDSSPTSEQINNLKTQLLSLMDWKSAHFLSAVCDSFIKKYGFRFPVFSCGNKEIVFMEYFNRDFELFEESGATKICRLIKNEKLQQSGPKRGDSKLKSPSPVLCPNVKSPEIPPTKAQIKILKEQLDHIMSWKTSYQFSLVCDRFIKEKGTKIPKLDCETVTEMFKKYLASDFSLYSTPSTTMIYKNPESLKNKLTPTELTAVSKQNNMVGVSENPTKKGAAVAKIQPNIINKDTTMMEESNTCLPNISVVSKIQPSDQNHTTTRYFKEIATQTECSDFLLAHEILKDMNVFNYLTQHVPTLVQGFLIDKCRRPSIRLMDNFPHNKCITTHHWGQGDALFDQLTMATQTDPVPEKALLDFVTLDLNLFKYMMMKDRKTYFKIALIDC